MAENDVLLHPLAAQVQIAILQAKVLIHIRLFIDVERRVLRRVQNAASLSDQLDLARGHVGILGPFGTPADLARNLKDILIPQAFGHTVSGAGCPRIEHNLDKTFLVPEIDEDQSPVVPPPVHPTRQRHRLTDVACGQIAGNVTSKQYFPLVPERIIMETEQAFQPRPAIFALAQERD